MIIKNKKLAIVGSRSIKSLSGTIPDCDLIISGGAEGVDSLAEKYAVEKNIQVKIFKPDYKRFGRGATHIRNREIVDAADFILFFWDGKSPGTKSVIKYAQKREKPYEVRNIKL